MSTFIVILCIVGYIIAGLFISRFTTKSMYLESSDPADCVALTVIVIIWPLLCIMYLIGRMLFNILR